MADAQLRDRFLVGMIDRVREDPYPSSAHMDLIESLLPIEEMDVYLEVLLEKVESENFPSPSMLGRIQRLTAQLPRTG